MARQPYTTRVGTIDVPSVDYPQFREQASMFSDLGKRIDSIRAFAIERGADESAKRGQEFAVRNPINANDYLNADPLQREKMLDAGSPNAYSRAVEAARITQLTTNLESYANVDITNLFQQAVQSIGTPNQIDMRELEAVFQGTIDGYTDTLNSDPQAALALYSSLTTKANTLYKSYADKVVEQEVAYRKSLASTAGLDTIAGVENIIGQDAVLGDMVTPWEDILKISKSKIINQYQLAGMSPDQIRQFTNDYDNEVQRSLKAKMFSDYVMTDKYYDNTKGTVANVVDIHNKLTKGEFLDMQQQRLYNSIEDKEAIIAMSREYRDDVVLDFENERDRRDLFAQDKKADLDLQMTRALDPNQIRLFDDGSGQEVEAQGPDSKLVADLLEEAEKLADNNPEFYGDWFKNFKARTGPQIGHTDRVTYTSLVSGIISGETTYQDIQDARTANIITIGQNSEYNDLMSRFTTARDKGVTQAYNIIKMSLGLPTLNEQGFEQATLKTLLPSERKKAEAKMDILNEQLITFINNNPLASGQGIKDYATNQILGYDEEMVITNGADKILTKINEIAVGPRGTTPTSNDAFNRVMRLGFDPRWSDMSVYTKEYPQNIPLLIDWLEEYQEYGSMTREEKNSRGNVLFGQWKDTDNWSKIEPYTGTPYTYEAIAGLDPSKDRDKANLIELILYLDELQDFYSGMK